jgi:O-antigen/teichoic acid export membrane protein
MSQALEQNYLLKVLGLSVVPKVITFSLTLVSFPLMLRALGAENYGTVVFLGAALSLFEVLMDFGVSSASGKSMAEMRTHRSSLIRKELISWLRLQLIFIAGGVAPMLIGAYLMVLGSPTFNSFAVFSILAATVCFTVVTNFLRANLNSLLAFKSLAILDTTESVIRSSGFLIVAFLVPTIMGLVWAGLVIAILSSTFAAHLLRLQLVRYESTAATNLKDGPLPQFSFTWNFRIKESLSFLWLRLASRAFQEAPTIILGKLFGAELVGIVAAFRKVIEILSTPYLIIGNALMVRVHEVSKQRGGDLRKFWDTAMSLAVTGLFLAIVVSIYAGFLRLWLLPDSDQAKELFHIMSFLVATAIVSALFTPMSDYYGGLKKRNIFLTSMATLQILVISFTAILFDYYIVILAMVVSNIVLATGYILIANNIFFKNYRPHVPRVALAFIASMLVGVGGTTLIATIALEQLAGQMGGHTVVTLISLSLITAVLLMVDRDTRRCYLKLEILKI